MATVNFGKGGGSIQSCNGELTGGNVENYSERGRKCQSQTCIALITFLNPEAGDQLCLSTVQMGEGVMGGWVLPIPPEQW